MHKQQGGVLVEAASGNVQQRTCCRVVTLSHKSEPGCSCLAISMAASLHSTTRRLYLQHDKCHLLLLMDSGVPI
jgi:hypothetical protein